MALCFCFFLCLFVSKCCAWAPDITDVKKPNIEAGSTLACIELLWSLAWWHHSPFMWCLFPECWSPFYFASFCLVYVVSGIHFYKCDLDVDISYKIKYCVEISSSCKPWPLTLTSTSSSDSHQLRKLTPYCALTDSFMLTLLTSFLLSLSSLNLSYSLGAHMLLL